MKSGLQISCSLCALALGLVPFAPLSAQAPAAAPEAQGDTTDWGNETIVVTAQRREQNLQDVPVAVTALTASDLENQGAVGTFNLEAAVPNLLFSKATNQVQVFLRGVGNQGLTPGNDPSVAMYIDGVYMSAPPGMMFAFNDIERIEVLRGPQGTLFGRNATGGLINIVSRDPTQDTRADVSVGYGSYGRFQSSAYLAGGSETAAAGISLIYNRQTDGWGNNLFTPAQAGPILVNGQPVTSPAVESDAGFMTEFGARGRIVLRPSDRSVIRIDGTYIHNRGDQNLYRNLLPGSIASADGVTPFARTGGFYDYNADVPWLAENDLYMISVNASHDTNFGTVRAISGYLDSKTYTQFDLDGTPLPANTTPLLTSRFRTFTQELQLISNRFSGPSWMDYTFGLYYFNSRAGFDPAEFVRGNNLEGRFIRYAFQDTISYAAYGQLTFDITDNTRLTGGLRYTRDRLTGDQVFIGTNDFATSGPFRRGQISSFVPPQRSVQSAFTWRLAIDHNITNDVLAYASYNRGYKSGAWNLGALCLGTAPLGAACENIQPAANPEIIDAFEIGLKSDWLNNRLRINLSAFYYDYSDLQVQAIVGDSPPVSILTNAASATSYGGEIEVVARPVNNFTINLSAAYLHAEYDDFPGAIGYLPRTAAPYGNQSITFNAAGNTLYKAPRFTANVGFNWAIPTQIGEFELSANWAHNSGFYWDALNVVREPAYNVVNAQLSFRLPGDHWRFRLWSNNLFGENYYSFVSVTSSNTSGAPAAPRTIGASLTWSY